MNGATTAIAEKPIDLPQLERSLRSTRSLFSYGMSVLTAAMTLIAVVPLVSVLYMLIVRGGERLSLALFTELPPAAGMAGGGIGNAIEGTLLIVAIASAISIPFGILAAIYLAEFGLDTSLASAVRFAAKVLTGLPSLLAGVFAYVTVVVITGRFSPLAAGVALALLMLPTIMLTAEEAIRMVPTVHARSRRGNGMYAKPGRLESAVAHRVSGHFDGCDARHRTCRRGDRSFAFHCPLQRLLAASREARTDGFAGGSHL